MNRTVTEIVVGLAFVIGVLLAGSYTILSSGVTFGPTKLYVVDFEQIYGLKNGDGVRVEGLEIGEVIEITPKGTKIRVVIEVAAEVDIYKDKADDKDSVTVVPYSPLGGRVVEINRGFSDGPRGPHTSFTKKTLADLQEEDVIQGKAQGELLQTLNTLVETNTDSVTAILTNLEIVSEQLTKDNSALGYLINSEEGGEHLSKVASSMSSAAQRLDRILERVEDGDGIVGGMLQEGSPLEEDLNGAMKAGRGALENVGAIVARADRGESALGVFVSDDPEITAATRGIVTDVKTVTGTVAEGKGSLGKLVHDDRLYEGAAGTAENLESITSKVDEGQGLLGVLLEEESGENARQSLEHLASITGAIDDPQGGTLGLLVHDQSLRDRLVRVSEELESLVVEFRDSIEDLREQAPINAFIGAVFSAF
ncbi:MAG: MCE family protein [Planctomycetes bacterium]|nr:MCE family protein [Planctomycetota bacterium]